MVMQEESGQHQRFTRKLKQWLSSIVLQVVPISHREHGLVIAAGICICVGPVLFTLLMLWEFKFAPKKHLWWFGRDPSTFRDLTICIQCTCSRKKFRMMQSKHIRRPAILVCAFNLLVQCSSMCFAVPVFIYRTGHVSWPWLFHAIGIAFQEVSHACSKLFQAWQ